MELVKLIIFQMFAAGIASAQESAPAHSLGKKNVSSQEKTVAKELTSAELSVIEYLGEDIQTALRDLARQAKMEVFVHSNVQGSVTLRFENKTHREVLEVIAYANNLVIGEEDGIYYIISRDGMLNDAAQRTAQPAARLFEAYIAKGFTRAEAMKLILNVPHGASFKVEPAPKSTSPRGKKK